MSFPHNPYDSWGNDLRPHFATRYGGPHTPSEERCEEEKYPTFTGDHPLPTYYTDYPAFQSVTFKNLNYKYKFWCVPAQILFWRCHVVTHGQERQIRVTPLPECQPSVSPPLCHRNRKVISTAHLRRSGQTVSEKGAEKERKGMEKILINKQEMNAAASKEGSIIDIDTGPTLNTVSGERGKENWEVVWGHMAARVQFGVPLDHFMLTEVVRNLKLTWTQ